jgi:hypothetical protein
MNSKNLDNRQANTTTSARSMILNQGISDSTPPEIRSVRRSDNAISNIAPVEPNRVQNVS